MSEKWLILADDVCYIRADRMDAVKIAEEPVKRTNGTVIHYLLQALVGGEWITLKSYRSDRKYRNSTYAVISAKQAAKDDLRDITFLISPSVNKFHCLTELCIEEE